jgi:hypothetical protein
MLSIFAFNNVGGKSPCESEGQFTSFYQGYQLYQPQKKRGYFHFSLPNFWGFFSNLGNLGNLGKVKTIGNLIGLNKFKNNFRKKCLFF